jgi:hypothetical protein
MAAAGVAAWSARAFRHLAVAQHRLLMGQPARLHGPPIHLILAVRAARHLVGLNYWKPACQARIVAALRAMCCLSHCYWMINLGLANSLSMPKA